MKRLNAALIASVFCLGASAVGPAQAQGYPNKPVRLIVPVGPGSGTDIITRVMADQLAEQMKATFVVENRAGGGGMVGAASVVQSNPDGYTLLMASNGPLLISPLLHVKPPYDPLRDLTAVTKIATMPFTVVTGPNAPYSTFKEIIAFIKANPGKVNYATSGKGTQSHLEVAVFLQMHGLKAQDIAYKNHATAMTEIMAGLVDFYFPVYPAAAPHVNSGKMRALAIGTAQRSPLAPDLPTFAEAMERPGFQMSAWFGFVAPAGTPAEIIAKLNDEITKAMTAPKVRERLTGLGAEIAVTPTKQYGEDLRQETEKWVKVITELGLRSDK